MKKLILTIACLFICSVSYGATITRYVDTASTAGGDGTTTAYTAQETIDNAAAVDKGGGLVGIPITGTSMSSSMTVTIASTTNYNGDYAVSSKTTNEIVITETYVAETFAGTETVDNANRAYATLSEWEAAEQTDLVSDGDIHQVICAASTGVADSGGETVVTGWTTGASNTVTIKTSTSARHDGTYPTGNIYRIENATGVDGIVIYEDFVTVDGIAITVTSAVNNAYGIYCTFQGAGANIIISNCIIKGVLSAAASGCEGIFINDTDITANAYNNIVYDFFQTSQANRGIRVNISAGGLYHNLVRNCNYNFEQDAGTITATNNVSFESDDDFVGTFATLTYNAMDDSDAGTGNINGLTWTDIFTDPANGDFTLKDAETDLLDAGEEDPSGLGYGTPAIAGNIRTATGWDIGPHEHIPGEITSPYGLADPPYITVTKPTPGNTYYLDPAGDGAGDGTEGAPFRQMEEFDTVAAPGDLCYVKAGAYNAFTFDKDGASGNEIVIEAFGDGIATFSPTGGQRNYITGDYVILDGGADRELVFDGDAQDADQVTLYLNAASNYCTVSRCVVKNAALTTGAGFSTINIGISSLVGGHKVYNCLIHNSASIGVYIINGTNIEVRNNIVRDNWGSGIQCNPHSGDAVSDVIVSGNLIFGNGFIRTSVRPGLTYLGDIASITTKNNILWNNKAMSTFSSDNGAGNQIVYNNTWYNNVDGGVRFNESNSTTFDIQNNIIYSNGATNWDESSGVYIKEADTESVNNLTTDPSFVSVTVADATYLTINSGSTDAYEQGTTLGSVTVDYFGNTRDAPYDIGAHEASETSGGIINKIIIIQ